MIFSILPLVFSAAGAAIDQATRVGQFDPACSARRRLLTIVAASRALTPRFLVLDPTQRCSSRPRIEIMLATMFGMLSLVYMVAAAAVQAGQYAVQPFQICLLDTTLIGGRRWLFGFELEHTPNALQPFTAKAEDDDTPLHCTPAFTRDPNSHPFECDYLATDLFSSKISTKIAFVFRVEGKYLTYELLPSTAFHTGLKSWSLHCDQQLVEERKST
ncbi:uncharacterized protein L969DRAFT_482905 [Mixia osmundae IAM 14324]|uniref:Autophagy-related protein 27 n=1 Tax=Mixia osmundae (strain CBS 9802 / IAM 14324 / JCM 22182 / KY 12970) TaxID=764103 RepID=G7E1A1_MIXOS|nr:uncharacterized protein L969DRAFT_482905 [Mixia osmundae IAM 14324]KEI38751.1 hypothetical protein L969DRAFT_482905 [Mixia osmundae IAM 14324]GAA96611.1 hypothetical protein E5Q_03281 [Mixia osmundae IAM 14324]